MIASTLACAAELYIYDHHTDKLDAEAGHLITFVLAYVANPCMSRIRHRLYDD